MGKIRAFSKRTRWKAEEVEWLRSNYAQVSVAELTLHFPNRDVREVRCKANWLGLNRPVRVGRTQAQVREDKRRRMAEKRALDPAGAANYGRRYTEKNRAAIMARMRDYTRRRFFWNKAQKLRAKNRATPKELARLWREQAGRCALTGRRLDRSAHLDHIVPRASGGGDEAGNLRWLCPDANLAKRALSDTDFIALCRDVVAVQEIKRFMEGTL